MRSTGRLVLSIVVTIFAFIGIQGQSWAENPGQQKTVLLRFHSFPMNPGEKVVGIVVTVSQGEIVHVMRPYGWSCQNTQMQNRKQTMDCFSTHSSYGINASGMMPVLSITDNSNSSSNNMSIEASIQIEREDGKMYTRQMKDSELSIQ